MNDTPPAGDRPGARDEARDPDRAEDRAPVTFRFAAAAALASCAVAVVLLASWARRLDARLAALAVVPGADVAGAGDPSAPGPFRPFGFGVVGAVRGDAATLERAVEALAASGEVAFVVLVGDVGTGGGEGEFRRLAASCRDRGVEVVAVPGAEDAGAPGFATWLSAERWWFRHRDRLFLGVPGRGPDDAAWLRERLAEAPPPPVRTFVFAAHPRLLGELPDGAALFGPDSAVGVARVTQDGFSADLRVVPTGPALDTTLRGIALAVAPVVRPTAGHVAVLAAAALLLFGAFRVVRALP